MPLFLLIRHGENEYVKTGRMAGRLPGVHLNEKGRSQAQAVAEKLAGAPIKAIYSSPLERAMETAEPLAKALDLEICPRPGLMETDIGEWQGLKVKGLSRLKVWKIVQRSPSLFRFPGGETFNEAQQRIVQELAGLAAQHEPKDLIACFSHSDPIKLAVAFYVGMPLDLFQRLSVSPGSISALYVGEAGSSLLTLNYDLSFNLPKN
jgi:probable phosphoglycerate mutase